MIQNCLAAYKGKASGAQGGIQKFLSVWLEHEKGEVLFRLIADKRAGWFTCSSRESWEISDGAGSDESGEGKEVSSGIFRFASFQLKIRLFTMEPDSFELECGGLGTNCAVQADFLNIRKFWLTKAGFDPGIPVTDALLLFPVRPSLSSFPRQFVSPNNESGFQSERE